MDERPILMGPGPAQLPWRVVRAMMQPGQSHLDPAFNEGVLDRTLFRLRDVFRTRNEIFAVPGSGRVALEAAVTSVVEPGDPVLCIVAGVFGGWIREMAERVGGAVTVFEVGLGQPIDIERLEQTVREGRFKILTMVHNETSTGATYPVEAVGQIVRSPGLLFLVDTVSSIAGIDVRSDEWGIDMNMTAPEKCFGAPIGLALVSVSPRAWQVMESRKRPATSFSYDLLRWKTMWLPKERGGQLVDGSRRTPIVLPIHLVYALREAVDMIEEEGLDRRIARHRRAGRAFRAALNAVGLSVLPQVEMASDTVSCIRLPEGITAKPVIAHVRAHHNIVIGGGMGPLRDTTLRVGHMGITASAQYVLPTLMGIEAALAANGHKFTRGAGIQAAQEIFEE
jgi:alanine-glyoxylate transaminase/serine-glyoxylate transaminase/serine-pyruvate transaminase